MTRAIRLQEARFSSSRGSAPAPSSVAIDSILAGKPSLRAAFHSSFAGSPAPLWAVGEILKNSIKSDKFTGFFDKSTSSDIPGRSHRR